ncbi:MAG: hypothetical protein DRR19_00400 [Candidatus Parabeggiatoa sp. nov. 1]|nr:MAG: hypothetical protein DRR19_00400 [Gammaproteobacteria bacterium]
MKNLMLKLYELLGKNFLFNDLSSEQIQQLADDVLDEPIYLKAGDIILREGEPASAMYILFQGNAEVIKKDPKSGHYHQLEVLSAGACIGEMALIDAGPRSANVRAINDVVLLVLPLTHLEKIPNLATQLKLKLGKVLAERLRSTNENVVKSLEAHLVEANARASLGYLTTYMLIASGLFILLLGTVSQLVKELSITTILSFPILLLFTLTIVMLIRKSGYPLRAYGLTTKNWRLALKESFLATLLVALGTILLKWYLVTMTNVMANEPIFDLAASQNLSPIMLAIACIFYASLTPVQEFLVRGGVQGALQMFLTGSSTYRTWIAIFIANLMFSALHVYISIIIAIFVFPVGLLWGWLYSRHGTIIGISISHLILGLFAFYVVGFYTILGV